MKLKYLSRIGIGLIVWGFVLSGFLWLYANDIQTKVPAIKQFAEYFNKHFVITLIYKHPVKAQPGDTIYYNHPEKGIVTMGEVDSEVKLQQYYNLKDYGETLVNEQEDLKYWVSKNNEAGNIIKLDFVKETADMFYDVDAKVIYVENIEELPKKSLSKKWLVDFWIYEHNRHWATADLQFQDYNSPEEIGEVLETLFDERTKTKVFEKINEFIETHEDKIKDLFLPFIENTLSDYFALIEDNITDSFDNHADDFKQIFDECYEGRIKNTTMPLVQEKAIPLFETILQPTLEELGSELWDNLPKTSFGWNAVKDSIIPFVGSDNLAERFDEWLETDAKPIIKKYEPEIMERAEEIINALVYDEELTQEAKEVLAELLHNPKLTDVLMEMAQEVVIDNPETVEFFKQVWRSDALQDRLSTFGGWVEPLFISLSDMILLDISAPGEEKINPNLVKVLRSQILWKEDKWWVATPTSPETYKPVKSHHPFQK